MDNNEIKPAAKHFMDMTQEHETSAALREARELLESARNAKRRFMANMSHEIRTPLNAIWGLLDLMLADEATPASQRELLASARHSAQLLVELIGDILDFTVIDKGVVKLESTGFSLRSVISSVIARQHELTHNKAVSIHSQVDDDVPDNLLGDSGRLYQILKHLVGNGIKFTHAGEVAVQVQRWPAANPTGGEREIELHFSIRDTGIGIAKEKLAQIFESLTQGDESSTRSFGGLGIGLNIVQRLVALLDGRVWIQSAPGQGTTVHFLLPFRTTTNMDEAGTGQPKQAASSLAESQAMPGWMLNPRLPTEKSKPKSEAPSAAGTAPLSAQWWQIYQRCQELLGADLKEAETLLKALRIEAGAAGYTDLSTVLFRLLLAVRRKDQAEVEQYRTLLARTVPQGRRA